jgi:hypothetical protein
MENFLLLLIVLAHYYLKASPLPPAPLEVQQLSRSEDPRIVALLRLLSTHLLLHGLSAKVPVLVGWLVDWLVVWLAGWLVDWLVSWLVGWLVGWFVGWLAF